MGGYALHPASATLSGNTLKAVLPDEITPSTAGSCSVMVAEIGNSSEITFRQLMSYFTVQLGNVSTEAVKIELKADKNLSGEVSATLPEHLERASRHKTGRTASSSHSRKSGNPR